MTFFRSLAGAAPAAFVSPLCRSLLVACALAVPLAQAADSPADAAARNALKQLVPQATIDAVEQAPIPGFRQVIVGGQMVYVSDDGQYLMQGTLYDIQAKRDLTGARLAVESKRKVDAVGADKRIVFAPSGKPKYKITVFTDIDCGYCRKLHSEVAELNKRGIEVDYLFFPRSGVGTPSFDKAVSVWCADDRKAALTDAKAGKDPAPKKCENPVSEQFALGMQVGVSGTPTILAPDGSKIGGYLPPDDLLAKLQSLGTAKLVAN
jgi:thiol:disulfide interchange protein DsbC